MGRESAYYRHRTLARSSDTHSREEDETPLISTVAPREVTLTPEIPLRGMQEQNSCYKIQ